jgi:hypothetical protein
MISRFHQFIFLADIPIPFKIQLRLKNPFMSERKVLNLEKVVFPWTNVKEMTMKICAVKKKTKCSKIKK